MNRWKHVVALVLGVTAGLLWAEAGFAQDAPVPAYGGFDGPPRDGDRPMMAPRDADRGGPPSPGERRRPGPDRRPPGPPLGPPPRWPHEDWGAMEKNDPEMFKLLREDRDLGRQTHEQAMQYRRAPKEQREQLKQKILELVNKHFDVRQQRRSLELKRLEEELKRLREGLERREKSREELVHRRAAELLGPADDLGF